jgi:hypothetical protein
MISGGLKIFYRFWASFFIIGNTMKFLVLQYKVKINLKINQSKTNKKERDE